MNGFGFIEYDDPMDAKDVVPGEDHPFLYLDERRVNYWIRLLIQIYVLSQLSVRLFSNPKLFHSTPCAVRNLRPF